MAQTHRDTGEDGPESGELADWCQWSMHFMAQKAFVSKCGKCSGIFFSDNLTELYIVSTFVIIILLILSYLSRSLADRWVTTVDFITRFLHSSRFSPFRSMMFHSRPVHSLMLSSHRFLCLPLRLPP